MLIDRYQKYSHLSLLLLVSVYIGLLSFAGSAKAAELNDWKDLIMRHQNSDEPTKLKAVNDFFNQIPYQTDFEHWGKNDYWATPTEFITSNAGDCEDYAIAKYITLSKLGLDEQKLRITHVRILDGNISNIKGILSGETQTSARVNFGADSAHMVLIYYPAPNAEPLVLDNTVDAIKPATERSDIKPIYSFNNHHAWLKTAWTQPERLYGNANKIRAWKEFRGR